MNLLILLMAIVILISALLANGLKNAKDGEFEYVKDDNTLLVFRLVMPLSVLLALLVGILEPWHWLLGDIPVDLGWSLWYDTSSTESSAMTLCDHGAIVLFVAGISLRWIAILSLKRAFTVKVTILKDHQLKSDGVYRWVRHPSYTGMYIYALGLGLALHSLLAIAILLWGVWFTTHNRIPVEEAVLEGHFGDAYRTYKQKTWKLFPLIY
ncbi:MAG: isoprenylcysteine carboxylmethyltransferase family protein [Sphingomonadales bacterium]|nr:isoprenylcysteine carboxylmethyltransferase family protein [Sphingomonadales bacterium]